MFTQHLPTTQGELCFVCYFWVPLLSWYCLQACIRRQLPNNSKPHGVVATYERTPVDVLRNAVNAITSCGVVAVEGKLHACILPCMMSARGLAVHATCTYCCARGSARTCRQWLVLVVHGSVTSCTHNTFKLLSSAHALHTFQERFGAAHMCSAV